MTPDSSLSAIVRPSPNHGDRKGKLPDAIILHYTGLATGAAALDHLCAEASQVSAHYLVDEQGELFQLVRSRGALGTLASVFGPATVT